MKKDLAIIFGLFLLIIVLVVFGREYTSGSLLGEPSGSQTEQRKGFSTVSIRDLTIEAKIVSRAGDRKKGLSGQGSLPITSGLLFVFDNSALYPFWMKDMRFAIDIIWIDENKKIVHIVQNAAPEPGLDDDELTLYTPPVVAKYVLEINAGLSARHRIDVGDEVGFEL